MKATLTTLCALSLLVVSMAGADFGSAQDNTSQGPTPSISASISCTFLGPGRRGFCSALPRGTGFIYNFYTSGPVSVATGPLTASARSATCGGFGSITVVITDPSGNTGSASTSTTCGNGN